MARTKNKGNIFQEIIISNPVAKFRFMSLVPLQGVKSTMKTQTDCTEYLQS